VQFFRHMCKYISHDRQSKGSIGLHNKSRHQTVGRAITMRSAAPSKNIALAAAAAADGWWAGAASASHRVFPSSAQSIERPAAAAAARLYHPVPIGMPYRRRSASEFPVPGNRVFSRWSSSTKDRRPSVVRLCRHIASLLSVGGRLVHRWDRGGLYGRRWRTGWRCPRWLRSSRSSRCTRTSMSPTTYWWQWWSVRTLIHRPRQV